MGKIRAMALTGMVLIGIAGVLCWHLAYDLVNSHHGHGYLFGLSFTFSGLAIAVTTATLMGYHAYHLQNHVDDEEFLNIAIGVPAYIAVGG